MRIVSIGGGPAGLFFSILFKKAYSCASITVHERNRLDDTFGWGVVFSDETLDKVAKADPELFAAMEQEFIHWSDIETFYRGTMVRSVGHGFCGLSRKTLLRLLTTRAQQLGVEVRHQSEIPNPGDLPAADLILAADGVHSAIRSHFAADFLPDIDWRRCRFSWLGTTLPLKAFTFVFKETPFGLFQVHAYPFERGLSTWIVECREEVFVAAGLDRATEEESVAFLSDLFQEELQGHPLLANRSIWRTFPTITCKKWFRENIALLGDAVHTAHFSIGSGTKLAMETAMALVQAFKDHPKATVPKVLEAWQQAREVDVLKTQKAAQTSLEWFENSARYMGQEPTRFAFNLMTRSKRITYDNLAKRDPQLVEAATAAFQMEEHAPLSSLGAPPPPAFAPFTVKSMRLVNRVVVSPMCQYMANDGVPNDWHLVHLGSRAIGGAGLIITEMTNISSDGRITKGCAGLYNDEQENAYRRVVQFVKDHSLAHIGVQLAHAGRKGSTHHPFDGRDVPLLKEEGAWQTLGPSALPFDAGWPAPREMNAEDMDRVTRDFVRGTERALAAGFDLVELHMAHGYLLSSFLSPSANQRTDSFGGSLANRMRFPLRVLSAVREVWPAERPLAVRISATDWMEEGGFTEDESVILARALQDHGCDILDVSTAGNTPKSRIVYGRMYQVPFAERIRFEVGIPVMAVGAIQDIDHANTVLLAGRADLICMARPHLYDPYLTLHAADRLGYPDAYWPGPYLAGRTARGQS